MSLIEDLIGILVALSRKMTLIELKNIWDYKFCFKVTTVEEGKNIFLHKSYSNI